MARKLNSMNCITKVFKLEEIDIDQTEELLKSHSFTLLYTSIPYLKCLKFFLNCEIEIITIESDEGIIGYFPLAFKIDPVLGNVCNSLPFYGSNGGMVIRELENKNMVRDLLLKEFYNIIEKKNCVAYTVISNPMDEEGDKWLKENLTYDLVDERIGQVTHFPDLKNDNKEQTLINSFEDPRPRNIRKAQKEGIKIVSSNNKEALDFLFKVHYDNITAINGIPKEKRFFDQIPQHFSNEMFKVYIAELNGEKIAALLLFYYNETVEYYTPAVIEQYRNYQPTALIIYQAMLDAINLGYKNWNWGGTWLSQGGVYDFKKKWGTTDHRYFYYTRIIKDSVYAMSKEDLLYKFPYFFVLPFSALKNDK